MSRKTTPFNKNLLIIILSAIAVVLFTVNYLKTNDLSFEKLLFVKTATPIPMPKQNNEDFTLVKEVIDGDTIVLENGDVIRYLGIDTPELHHPKVGEECGGKEASDANSELVAGKKVKLEKDITDKDQYGRLLRFVFSDDGVFVNYELIRRGYAQVLAIPPDKKFEKVFIDAQLTAKNENLGIWQKCFNK